MNLVTTMSMITKHRKNDDVNEVVSNGIKQIFIVIAKCISGTKHDINVSTSKAQKYNSLKGRQWVKAKFENAPTTTSTLVALKRGHLFVYNTKIYKVLNVFAKIYNKWHIEECVNAYAQSKVQAVAVLED